MKPIQLIAFCVIFVAMVSASSATQCSVVTIREPPHLIPIITNYNETTLDTVQHFLNHLEPCPRVVVCGMRARYTSIEADKVGLQIGEVTIRDWDRARNPQFLFFISPSQNL